jgi:transglutaminase-like putative cysteine protease
MKAKQPDSQTAKQMRTAVVWLAFWLSGFWTLAALAAPPSGRPPIGPLKRYEPKVFDLTFGAGVSTLQQRNALDKFNYRLENAPIVMPIVFLGAYSKVQSESVKAQLWLESREADPHLELKSGFPHNTHLATLSVEQFVGQSVRWQVAYRLQVWSSRIDDEQAAKIAWPKEWPKEVQDGLQPQTYIQSDDPVFAEEVQKISQGKLRLVPPYLAAKDLIRHCVNSIQISGSANIRDEFKILRGMNVEGARQAAERKIGSPHDLVCVCVAMLRAAGIPARPVIGVRKNEHDKGEFVSWAEFYLPEAGWVPFDPIEMRGKAVRNLDVRKAWPEFGTMKDLNERIPLAYHFLPPASVESPRNPAVWGWDPRPGRDAGSEQHIQIVIASLGRGIDDPQ